MNRGGKILVSTAVLAIAACAGGPSELQVRARSTALAPGERPVAFRIAEARGQLALGNVALALESFRKAQREDPNSTDALAGMATCYDRMGRFDVSRRYYESALALAPSDVRLLGAFAASLELQGARIEALKVRREIAVRSAPAVAVPQPQAVAAAAMPVRTEPRPAGPEPIATAAANPVQQVAPAETVRIVLPEPRPVAPEPARVASAPPQLEPAVAPEPLKVASAPPQLEPAAAPEPARVASAPPPAKPAVPVALLALPAVKPASSVTVNLPEARPLAAPVVAEKAVAVIQPLRPVVAAKPIAASEPVRRPAREVPVVASEGPRLERLSMAEVALITTPAPLWRGETVTRTARSTTVRWVPLREASAQPARVRLLNAARVNRLAARTRSWLVARGWRSLGIGDAPTARARSVVIYPPSQRALAQTLSNQFGFAMEEQRNAKFVTMLLGQDAARIEELRPKSA